MQAGRSMARPCILSRRLMPGQPSPGSHGSLPLQRRLADQRLWLSLCLIHRRPGPFTGERDLRVRAGYVRWRPVVNSGAQYSKAVKAQVFRGFKSHLHRH